MLRQRITFTPRPLLDGCYEFAATTRFDKLFTGIAHNFTVRGMEHLVYGRDWVYCPDDARGAKVAEQFGRRDELDDD